MPVRALALVLLVLFTHLSAEAPPAPRFATVSVRAASAPGGGAGSAGVSGHRWTMTGGTLRTLLDAAYPTGGGEILNAPAWIDEPLDVNAVAAAPPSREELQAMLRSLLAEQFAFSGHVEEQERWAPDAHGGHAVRIRVQVLVIEQIERP